jgi:hypothetical protein
MRLVALYATGELPKHAYISTCAALDRELEVLKRHKATLSATQGLHKRTTCASDGFARPILTSEMCSERMLALLLMDRRERDWSLSRPFYPQVVLFLPQR